MPKKTKKQKLLAELHRKISLVSSPSPEFVKTQNKNQLEAEHENTFSPYTYNKQSVTTTKISISALDYSHIKSDLIKILLFTLFALISQGVLYFILRTR